jgi:hypothetical protein
VEIELWMEGNDKVGRKEDGCDKADKNMLRLEDGCR